MTGFLFHAGWAASGIHGHCLVNSAGLHLIKFPVDYSVSRYEASRYVPFTACMHISSCITHHQGILSFAIPIILA